jgi:hypothetical protein
VSQIAKLGSWTDQHGPVITGDYRQLPAITGDYTDDYTGDYTGDYWRLPAITRQLPRQLLC